MTALSDELLANELLADELLADELLSAAFNANIICVPGVDVP